MRRHSFALAHLLLVVTLAICCAAGHAAGAVIYVSPQGNDLYSGALARPDEAGTDGPFATLERARDEIRALSKAGALAEGATVYVRGGEYFLEETFALETVDSGTAEAPIRYVAYPGEEPILVGGAQLTGFKPYKGKIVSLDLKTIGRDGLSFGQLFYDGKRQVLARYPNYDHDNPYAGGFLYIAANVGKLNKEQFEYGEGELGEWSKPTEGQVWVFPGRNYWNNIVPIKSVDRDKRIVTLAKPCSYELNKGDRYFVRGLFEELDAPGEWYLDRASSTLYFWPPGDISRRVSAPIVGSIVSISKPASVADRPHDIIIHGFTLEGCDGTAVSLSNCTRCWVIGNTIRNAGSGVSVGTGKDNLIFGNDISQTGSSGVGIWSGNRSPLQPDRNRVENNYIHHTGYFSKTSSAIGFSGVGNTISHNLVHDCPRIAISFGGNDHLIEYNHCRHMNLETQDSGAIYSCARDWTQRGNVIRYNYVHDTLGYGRHGGIQWHTPFFTFGIYLDDWSSGTQVYGNIVARSFLAGIDIHSGRDCVVDNNIIYNCRNEQMRYQAWPTEHRMLPDMLEKIKRMNYPPELYPGLQTIGDARADATMSYNVFERNIISYGGSGSRLYAVSGLDYETTEHDYNVIWRWEGEPDSSLDKMRENGLDSHSIVADPMLVDPEKGDFRLRPESPALKLGFRQIPVDEIGPYEHPLRATWPIVEAQGAREHPHMAVKAPVRRLPRYTVGKRQAPITIDGRLAAEEWHGLDRARAMVLGQHPSGDDDARPRSYAWLCYDAQNLYVGLVNLGVPKAPSGATPAWGGDDGAEVCLQDVSGGKPGPIFVLQGFASGHFQSTDHAGAPMAVVDRIGTATQFAAGVYQDQWQGEWRIPWAEAGIDPSAARTLRFNIGVRKTCGSAKWVVWIGTGCSNWMLDSAGEIVLE